MKVYLVGYMGSGKSTVGRLLADQLKLNFIDFDVYIENKEGQTISEIFEKQGENKFRELEQAYLKKMLPEDNVVIALGGGTPCFYNNMELINTNGASVYIELDADTLANRLSNEKNNRPLIKDLKGTALKYFIETNLEKRGPVYRKAKYTVQGSASPADIVAKIIKLTKK